VGSISILVDHEYNGRRSIQFYNQFGKITRKRHPIMTNQELPEEPEQALDSWGFYAKGYDQAVDDVLDILTDSFSLTPVVSKIRELKK